MTGMETIIKRPGHCEDPTCAYCALHCPYCGGERLLLAQRERRMRCLSCGRDEELVTPAFIVARHGQVLVLTGHPIDYWKLRGRQLSPRFHYRWRSTLAYLNPAASTALVHLDRWLREGVPDYEAVSRAMTAMQRDPSLVESGSLAEGFPDDWF